MLVRSSIRLSIDAATASYHEGLHGSPLAYAHRPLTAESAALRWPSLRRVSAQPQIDYSPQGPLLQSFQDNEGHDSAPLVTSVPVQRQQALAEAQLNGGGSLSRAADAHAQQVSGSSVDSQTSPLLDPLLRNAGPGAQYMGASEAGQGPGDAHQGDIQGAAGHKLLQMPQLPIGRISVLVAMFLGMSSLSTFDQQLCSNRQTLFMRSRGWGKCNNTCNQDFHIIAVMAATMSSAME